MWLRLDNWNYILEKDIWYLVIIIVPFSIIVFWWLGLYRIVLRYFSQNSINTIALSIIISSIMIFVFSQFLNLLIPRSVPGIYFFISFILIIGSRFLIREFFLIGIKDYRLPVVIYGAGNAGIQLLSALRESREYIPIFFFDDNPVLNGTEINGLIVYSFNKSHLLASNHIKTVLLAMPSISISERKSIVEKLEKFSVKIKLMPVMSDIINGKTKINNLKNITIEEILEREIIPPIEELMTPDIKNRNVLVTGAGGSIGSELCKEIIKNGPKTLILLDSSEFALYQINSELNQEIENNSLKIKLIPLLGLIQNKELLKRIFSYFNVNTLYHAAAYKHVPLLEQNVIEGIRNNTIGTKTLIEAAIKAKINKFVLISTDKAVRPTNFMGASKRLSELICQSFAKRNSPTIISIVRFGNVMGSSGSVIPLFKKQIEIGGPVTVTHKNIQRYFMTIKEAAQLVIQAGAMGNGGDVFLLDMGKPVKIIDLAVKMIRLYGLKPYLLGENSNSSGDIEIKITSIRPGEKLYEELLIDKNSIKTSHPRIMSAKENSLNRITLDNILMKIEIACKKNDVKSLVKVLKNSPIYFKTIPKINDVMYSK